MPNSFLRLEQRKEPPRFGRRGQPEIAATYPTDAPQPWGAEVVPLRKKADRERLQKVAVEIERVCRMIEIFFLDHIDEIDNLLKEDEAKATLRETLEKLRREKKHILQSVHIEGALRRFDAVYAYGEAVYRCFGHTLPPAPDLSCLLPGYTPNPKRRKLRGLKKL